MRKKTERKLKVFKSQKTQNDKTTDLVALLPDFEGGYFILGDAITE